MNDIYEHKAKKYKYKYLKLKKELEGGQMLDIFRSEKTIKENTIKILKQAIQDVNDEIIPLFKYSYFLGRIYSIKGYKGYSQGYLPKKKPSWSDKYLAKIEDINQYVYERQLTEKEYPSTLYWFYYFKYQMLGTKKPFNRSKFRSNLDLNYQKKYDELPEKDRITNLIEPIARTLDIYLMIMFIKDLFYLSSKFDPKTIDLVKKLINDAYINEINSPEILIERIQEIINSINDSIPITPTTTKK